MKCPFCGAEDTQVKDSRPTDDNSSIRRRRICPSCEGRFTTFERIQLRELMVQKSDGRREPFQREKMLRSLRLPLQKRPIAPEEIDSIANSIVRRLEMSGDSDITAQMIGQYVMEALSKVDSVAYVRYASIYSDFREVTDFTDFLNGLQDVCIQGVCRPVKKVAGE